MQPDALLPVQQAAQQAEPPAVQPSVQREEEQPGTSTEAGRRNATTIRVCTALQRLHVCVWLKQSLLPHGDAVLTAKEYHELEGEWEVVEDLSDAATVRMIQSNNDVDLVDSDEDEADELMYPQPKRKYCSWLLVCLSLCLLSRICLMLLVCQHYRTHGASRKAIESGKKQTSLIALFGARM
jgi:hypothetical protein